MTRALPAAPMAAPRRAIQCAGCRAFVPEHQWLALEIAETIGAAEVSRLLLGWSKDECIEVRRCGHQVTGRRS